MKLFFILCFMLSILFVSGCATQYSLVTEKEELSLIGSEREVKLGRSIAERVEEKYDFLYGEEFAGRVSRIGERIAEVCDRKEIVYHFKVLDEDDVNAFALPGGYVYVNRDLMEKVESDDELACVLAHEVGHIVARHAIKRLQGSLGYTALQILISQRGEKTSDFRRRADVAFLQLLLSYSREDEFLADKLAIRYIQRAGYNPEAMVTFLERLQKIKRKEPIRPQHVMTHPYISERIGAARSELYQKEDFQSYINRPVEEF